MGAFVLTMENKHNYVTCNSCDWSLTNDPDRDWSEHPCFRCKNTRQVIDPKEILCNLCGGCMCPIGTMNEQYPHGLVDAEVTGGYDSYHLLDMNAYTFSFCEECLRKLFIQCKIKPDVRATDFQGNYRGDNDSEYDQEYYEYRIWEKDGGKHQAYLDGKCNFKKECSNKAVYTHWISESFTENCSCEEHKNLQKYANGELVPFISNVLKPFL